MSARNEPSDFSTALNLKRQSEGLPEKVKVVRLRQPPA